MFDCSVKTGLAVINIKEGNDFGFITVTNKDFW
jgi:hypothetical protein